MVKFSGILGLTLLLALGGCWNDSSMPGASANSSQSSSGSGSGSGSGGGSATSLSIAGSPMSSTVAGMTYIFNPSVQNPDGAQLTFSIEHAPPWASFSPMTGELTGTPTAADVGTYSNIVIEVSNGSSTATLPAFAINVTEQAATSITLSWQPPTENTNGTPLTDLAGYIINYGTDQNHLTESIHVATPGVASYVVSNLSPGTWYFTVVAYTSVGTQSNSSPVVSTTIG
jgi:hypothetical protein